MPSVTMLGKLAVVLVAVGQAKATVDTFGPSFLETLARTSAEPATVTSAPKHVPYGGGYYAGDAAVEVEGDPAFLAESGVITTVTVYTATCPMSMSMPMTPGAPTVMISSASSAPAWTHSSVATLFSTRPTTTTSPTAVPWSSAPASSASSAASSSTTTSSPTPNAPGTPTVSTVSAAPPLNETATRVPPAMPTQTHHDSAGSIGMAAAAVGYSYKALVAVFAGLVLPVVLGA